MSRVVIVDFDKRARPCVVTPAKGSAGDMTNESQRNLTDIDFILKRYGGNLAELEAWRGSVRYGDQAALPVDLVDAFNILKDAHDAFDSLQDNPFSSFDEAMSAIADGSFMDKITKKTVDKPDKPVDPPVDKPDKPVESTVDKTVNNGDITHEA